MSTSTDNTAARFIARSRTELQLMMTGARIVLALFGVVGIVLVILSADGEDGGRTATLIGLTLVVLAGQMVIAIGALRGHLTLLRAIEHVRITESEQTRILTNVAEMTEDELGHRRGQNGGL